MQIDCLAVGAYATNCYVLRASEDDTGCVVIDVGMDATDLLTLFKKQGWTPCAVILTHGHADHIAGLTAMRESFPNIKVYVHKLDASMLADPQANLSIMSGVGYTTEPAEVELDDHDMIDEAGIQLKVIHTPGHTPGGICLYEESEGILFSDDVLFAESVGRTDFPKGDMSQLLEVIRKRLWVLPDNTQVLPGHGPETTIGHEKQYNPFVR